MDSPETYNRVKHIEASTGRAILTTLNSLLFAIVITCFIAAWLAFTPWLASLIVAGVATLLFIGIWYAIAHRERRCRFCGNDLHHVHRAMILSPEYLAMQGIKQGDLYYAPCEWGKKNAPTGWAKISHRAIACHHCRISREGYHPHFEAVSKQELSQLKSS